MYIWILQTEYGQNETFLVLTMKNFSFCFIYLDTGTYVNKLITVQICFMKVNGKSHFYAQEFQLINLLFYKTVNALC